MLSDCQACTGRPAPRVLSDRCQATGVCGCLEFEACRIGDDCRGWASERIEDRHPRHFHPRLFYPKYPRASAFTCNNPGTKHLRQKGNRPILASQLFYRQAVRYVPAELSVSRASAAWWRTARDPTWPAPQIPARESAISGKTERRSSIVNRETESSSALAWTACS